MRDAFGGAFMIKVFLVFIMIYIGFTAMSLNYAKAFKVKNKVIDYLESAEITSLNNMPINIENAMTEYFEKEVLGKMNYNMSDKKICEGVKLTNDAGQTIAYCHEAGIIIQQSEKKEEDSLIHNNTEGIYYTVTTFIGWRIPFLDGLLKLSDNDQEGKASGLWKISGETRLIVN